MEEQKIKNVKGNNEKKNVKEGGLAIPDLKLYYKGHTLRVLTRSNHVFIYRKIIYKTLKNCVYTKHFTHN